LVDERLDDRAVVARTRPSEDVSDRDGEREAAYALRGPVRVYLAAGDAPDLLRVGLEEGSVESPAEAVRHPLLERALALQGEEARAKVAQKYEQAFEGAEAEE